jgi:hypothetical protein
LTVLAAELAFFDPKQAKNRGFYLLISIQVHLFKQFIPLALLDQWSRKNGTSEGEGVGRYSGMGFLDAWLAGFLGIADLFAVFQFLLCANGR